MMILVVVAAIACAVWPVAVLLMPEFRFHTRPTAKEFPIDLLVLDDATGEPVSGALVEVDETVRRTVIRPFQATTGKTGRARLAPIVPARGWSLTAEHAGGGPVTLWRSESVRSLAGWEVRVKAPGYGQVRRAFDAGPPISAMTVRVRTRPVRGQNPHVLNPSGASNTSRLR